MSSKAPRAPRGIDRATFMIEGLKKYQLNKQLSMPVYYQLASLIQYLADQLAPVGDEWILLPVKHELEVGFGVSQNTIERAYRLLAYRGVIERYPGKGTKIVPGYTRSNFLIGHDPTKSE